MKLEWSDEALDDLDRFTEFVSGEGQLPVGKNIARSYCRYSAAYVFQYRFDGQQLVMLRVYHARETRE